MQGFKDVISSVTGGDTLQIWLQTNGYAFTRNAFCEFDVITHEGQELKITPPIEKVAEEKIDEQTKDEEKKDKEK